MKNIVIILFLLIFNTSAFSDITSNLVADKHKDNEWVVSYITKNSIHASVNGQVTSFNSIIQEGCRLVVQEKLGIISKQRKQRNSLNNMFV